MVRRSGGERLPLAVWIIGFGIFAQGTSELMLAGLLPDLANDLGVSVPQAGLLISAFALGMLVGAPVLAAVTLRWPARRALLAFLVVFVAAHAVGALTSSFEVLAATRFVGAFAYAGFWAVGGSTAMRLAGPDDRGRAMGIVAGGLTAATVLGLPGGTWIGDRLGWRGSFWTVAVLTAVAAVAAMLFVPDRRVDEGEVSVRRELRGLRVPRLWLSYAMTAVATCALIGTFSYLAALLVATTGIDPGWVPAILFGYGAGALVGITLGGRVADRFPRATLGAGFAGLLATSVVLALVIRMPVPVVVLVVALGFVGFVTNPALNSRVVGIAPRAPTLAVSGNVSAFNVGITAGPWIGGLALSSGADYAVLPWIGAATTVVVLLLWAIDSAALSRRGSGAVRVRQSPS